MKTISINLFKFNELSEEAKKKALMHMYDINIWHEWWDYTYEDAINIGLKINGFSLDRDYHIKAEFIYNASEVSANILRDHGTECETYKISDIFYDNHSQLFSKYIQIETNENSSEQDIQNIESELIELENEYENDIKYEYLKILEREYEYLISEKAIIETIECNEYDFTEDGLLY
jgi:hypothetical protein